MIVRKVRPNRSAIAASARRWSDASEAARALNTTFPLPRMVFTSVRSEEHTSELQSQSNPVCRLLLEIKKRNPGGSEHATRHVRASVMYDPVPHGRQIVLRAGPAALDAASSFHCDSEAHAARIPDLSI